MYTDEYKKSDNNTSYPSAGTKLALMLIPSFLVFLSGLLMILCSVFISGKQSDETASESVCVYPSTESESIAIIETESEYYIIREDDDGFIAVYLSDGALYRRLDIRAYTLPQKDRSRLRIGIPVHSDRELDLYIEGFSG